MTEGDLKKLLWSIALLAAPAFAQAPAEAPPAPVDYADEASWLCLPGRADACGRPQRTADLTPTGYGPVMESGPAVERGRRQHRRPDAAEASGH